MGNLSGCPGEKTCISDPFKGRIASLEGKREGRTLENYCHNKVATASNGLKQGCPLYDTKPENTPSKLLGAIEAAELLRRYKLRGLLPPITELTAWEYCCFDVAEEAADKIEAEALRESTDSSSSSSTNKIGGKGTITPLGVSGEIEPEGAMSKW